MPQAATLPRASHTRRTVRHVPLEERVSVLETHAQSIATVADVRAAENRLILWILSAAVALAGFCFAILSGSEGRIDKRMDALDTALNKRMDTLDTALNKRMDALDSRMDKFEARIDRLEERMDRLDAKVDSRFDKLDAKFDALLAELRSQRRGE